MNNPIGIIAQLKAEQIVLINDYLKQHSLEAFSEAQLTFLNNIEEMDPLGLAVHCNLIRGYLGSFEHIPLSPLNWDENGNDCDSLMEEWLDSLNENDYATADLEELKSETLNEFKLQIAHHGLILSSGTGSSEVLFLNSEYQPLFLKFIRFN